jgi:hypothetical protein
MVSQPSRDGRGRLDRAVDAGEVVEREEQPEHRVVVFPFLAVRVCQAGEPANRHADRPVVPLDVASANRMRPLHGPGTDIRRSRSGLAPSQSHSGFWQDNGTRP